MVCFASVRMAAVLQVRTFRRRSGLEETAASLGLSHRRECKQVGQLASPHVPAADPLSAGILKHFCVVLPGRRVDWSFTRNCGPGL